MDQTKIAVEVFNKLAHIYQEGFMDVSMYYDSFDTFCQYIPKANASLLELACGPGNITPIPVNKTPRFKHTRN